MKSSRPIGGTRPGSCSGLQEIAKALKAGRLVGLLNGEGLNRNTIDELLRPESVVELRAILTEHLGAPLEPGAPESKRGTLLQFQSHGGSAK